jgi:outer membrane protein assembly factor BamB
MSHGGHIRTLDDRVANVENGSMRTATAIVGCILSGWVACGPIAGAADWPQWGGTDHRNLVSDETGLPSSFVPGQKDPATGNIDLATTQNVKWGVRLGGIAYGNPTVAGGRVFVGTDGMTMDADPRFTRREGGMVKCFDEATGKLLWQLVTPIRTVLPKAAHFGHQQLGTCSSPTVDGDRVYVVSSAGEVLCLDVHGQADGNQGPFLDEARYMVAPGEAPVQLQPTDADIIWRYDPLDELGVCPHDAASCSILIHGDVLYLSTSNGADGTHEKIAAPEAPAFIALDKRTGRLLATEDEHLSRRIFHAQWCSPSLGKVGDRTLIFLGGGDGVCYAFEALETVPEKPVKLKKVWWYDCVPPQYRFRDGKPIGYTEGDKLWTKGSPNKGDGRYVGPADVIGTPVFVNGRVYVGIGRDPTDSRGRGMFHCIDATKTGDITESGRIWSYDGLDWTVATAAVAGGLVYIGDLAGRMHCLDADTGKCYWVYESGAEAWGGALAADGKLYFGNQKELVIMAQGKESRVLSKIRLGAPVYSTPIVANGTLYVASQRGLWAVQKK